MDCVLGYPSQPIAIFDLHDYFLQLLWFSIWILCFAGWLDVFLVVLVIGQGLGCCRSRLLHYCHLLLFTVVFWF
jgi:hypothetical protein